MSAIERYNGPVHSPAAVNYDKWLLGTDIEGVTLSVVHVHSADAASPPPRDPEPRYKGYCCHKIPTHVAVKFNQYVQFPVSTNLSKSQKELKTRLKKY